MTIYGDDRKNEIERVQRRLSNVIRREIIAECGNLSWIEGAAAALRAVEDFAHTTAWDIRDRARRVSAENGATHEWGSDYATRTRDQLMEAALASCLPLLRREAVSLIECEARLRRLPDGGWEPVIEPLDGEAADLVAPFMLAIAEVEHLIGRRDDGPEWLDDMLDGRRAWRQPLTD